MQREVIHFPPMGLVSHLSRFIETLQSEAVVCKIHVPIGSIRCKMQFLPSDLSCFFIPPLRREQGAQVAISSGFARVALNQLLAGLGRLV